MQRFFGLLALALALPSLSSIVNVDNDLDTDVDVDGHHHHHGHHKHHKKKAKKAVQAKAGPQDQHVVTAQPRALTKAIHASANLHPSNAHSKIVEKMKEIEAKIQKKAQAAKIAAAAIKTQGHLLVNGPLPADFNERFAQAVGHATATDPATVKITDATSVQDGHGVVEVAFVAPPKVVKEVENEAADPESKLANGNMHSFLVADADDAAKTEPEYQVAKPSKVAKKEDEDVVEAKPASPDVVREVTPVEEKGIDIDTQMPYGDLEPFGREDTAQELTESSVKESDEMVDQLERAEVAEEKRATFRALTRLRGAAITSFDGVARSQTGNIDEYNKVHKWRKTHPLHHLADEESDVSKWAFPDNADFIQMPKKSGAQKK